MSRDRHALERFQREAQAASALNHPNICTIHDIDEHEGRHFIAMEYLEGKTLKHRIQGKPLAQTRFSIWRFRSRTGWTPHTQKGSSIGIKPANIFITSAGHAKISISDWPSWFRKDRPKAPPRLLPRPLRIR